MNIGYNCSLVDPNYSGGVNTYVFGLLKGLISVSNNDRIQIYVTRLNNKLFHEFSNFKNVDVIVLPMTINQIKWCIRLCNIFSLLQLSYFHRLVSDFLFKSWVDIINKESHVIYTPTTVLFPYGFKIPSLLSMHDIQQYTYPNFFTKKELLHRKTKYTLSAKLANCIQASSSFIKNDLLKHYNFLNENAIEVISEGVLIEEFTKISHVNVLEKYKIPNKYLFFPAQLWSHKNHISVLKALKILVNTKNKIIPLVLTGASYSGSKEIINFIDNNKDIDVYYLGKIPFEDIVALYQNAQFFITAVLYESSSLPFLEAAASGCPIIASRTIPNVEMSKTLMAELFDPLDHNYLASLIEKIWNDDELIIKQVEHNKNAVLNYHWKVIASQYLKVLHKLNTN